jgi:transitional endoplasmic reticulum ATPase
MKPREFYRTVTLGTEIDHDPAVVHHARNLVVGLVRHHPEWLGATVALHRRDPDFAPIAEVVGATSRAAAERHAQRIEAAVADGRLTLTPAPRALGVLGENLAALREILGLDEVEVDILQVLVLARRKGLLKMLIEGVECSGVSGWARLLAAGTARPEDQVRKALDPEGRLVGAGLLDPLAASDLIHTSMVAEWLVDALREPGLDRARLLRRLLPEAPGPTIDVGDVAHLASELETAEAILGRALNEGTRGVNVLLYGPPGTGKSEFARLLARRVGAALHLGGAPQPDQSDGATERVASARFAQRMLGGSRALLLVDEAEDVFPDLGGFGLLRPATKQGMVLLLEQNRVPAVWVTNTVDGMDEAVRRRFGYAVRFERPGIALRRTFWRRHAANTALGPADLDALAHTWEVGPAQIVTAARSAALASGAPPNRAAVERVLAPLVKLMGGKPVDVGEPEAYDPAVVNATIDPGELFEKLSGWRQDGRPGLTLLLHGPPGTGKSAFVHVPARRMDRRVMARTGADLLSMWVGGSEQNIAAVFEEAEREPVVLLLDEVDSLVSDRRGHSQTWESSQTNEILQQLDRFRGVVACTTNRLDRVDAAALRRFIVKVGFDYLDADQALAAFEGFFGSVVDVPDGWRAGVRADLARIGQLAPGDFAAVRRRLRVLGTGRCPPETLVAELRREVAVKEGVRSSVGFAGVGRARA